jgi:hypothetical protein
MASRALLNQSSRGSFFRVLQLNLTPDLRACRLASSRFHDVIQGIPAIEKTNNAII